MHRWATRNVILHATGYGLLRKEIAQSEAVLWRIFAVWSRPNSPSMEESSWLPVCWPEPTDYVLLVAQSIVYDANKSNDNSKSSDI